MFSSPSIFSVPYKGSEIWVKCGASNVVGVNFGARIEDGLPARTIDGFVKSDEITRIDFIKLDVAGSELGALQGGENSLRRWRPKLALSLHHPREDFLSIPLWLNSL